MERLRNSLLAWANDQKADITHVEEQMLRDAAAALSSPSNGEWSEGRIAGLQEALGRAENWSGKGSTKRDIVEALRCLLLTATAASKPNSSTEGAEG